MSTENGMTIIEINGVKMEVDLRHAKMVHENIRVGSKVKLLEKSEYGSNEVHPGVVVGFEPFVDQPTIIVAYIKVTYNDAPLKFAFVSAATVKKWSLVPSVDDHLPLVKTDVIKQFDREIEKKKHEIKEIEERKAYFLRHFDRLCIPEGETA